MFYCLIKNSSFCYINIKLYIFYFILGNIVEGGVHVSTLPDYLLDQQPTHEELISHARTAEWNQLGVKLGLDSVDLTGCCDCTSMYQLWIMEKASEATRRNLLDALRAIRQNDVRIKYEDYLQTIVSYIVHILIYTCT